MKLLTDKQQNVLDFIKNYLISHQFPPTIREIADNFETSVRAAWDHLKALEKKGVIKCEQNRSRAIELIEEFPKTPLTRNVPILGTIVAGIPLESIENFEGYIPISESGLSQDPHFALKVKGESMIEAGIFEGDLAIIRQQETASNGDIVVAMIDDSVTLKRFFRENNRIRLQAENPQFTPIYTSNVRILGKLCQIIRSY